MPKNACNRRGLGIYYIVKNAHFAQCHTKEKSMQKTERKGQNVTAEDVAAALKPLLDEYFEGASVCMGDSIRYILPDGQRFFISVRKD